MTRTYSIADFGAVSNSELQTRKIQAAIDRAFLDGGGEVIVPAGEFRVGSVRLRSRVTLHLMENAVLKGSQNPEDYMSFLEGDIEPVSDSGEDCVLWIKSPVLGRWNNAVVRAIDAVDIAIVGEPGSRIDGGNCYDSQGEEGYRGPHAICIHRSRNVTLTGYTVVDSANWAHAIFTSQNIHMKGVTVLAGHDGVDVFSCDNVVIEDCSFITGDDCVAGFDDRNVLVKNCELNCSCQAIRFGGVNAIFDRCKIYGPGKYAHRCSMSEEERKGMGPTNASHRHNMIAVLLYYCSGMIKVRDLPGHLLLRGCEIDCVSRLLVYNFTGKDMLQTNLPLQSVQFENLRISGVRYASQAWGSPETPVTVEFADVDCAFNDESQAAEFLRACHFERITLRNVTVRGKHLDTLVRTWSDGKTEFDSVTAGLSGDRFAQHGDGVFFDQKHIWE